MCGIMLEGVLMVGAANAAFRFLQSIQHQGFDIYSKSKRLLHLLLCPPPPPLPANLCLLKIWDPLVVYCEKAAAEQQQQQHSNISSSSRQKV